ncbi:MAG: ABC transporter permease [Kiloniellales bacterium]
MSLAASLPELDRGLLKRDLHRAERLRRWKAIALVAPLFLFVVFTFIVPIADMLRRSVYDSELAAAWPQAAVALRQWDGGGVPDEALFAAVAADMKSSYEARTLASVARRINYALRNGRSLVMSTGRSVAGLEQAPESWKAAFLESDPAWGKAETWAVVQRAAGPYSDFFLLSALDLQHDSEGDIVAAPSEQSIYLRVLGRTFWISTLVTALCLLFGFPVAYLIAHSPPRRSNLLMILVLLPFWTSLLVRSAAWIVLLQDQGIVNDLLRFFGFTDEPIRMIFNRTGVVVAMVHVLLPFMILPMVATMKTIPPSYMRAALSLGAPPAVAFLKVYLPQTLPGVSAGTLLVFIMALGYYVTPALVGGANDQMLAYFIAFYTTSSVNWGLAAALGVLLLTVTGVLYAVYSRLVGMGKVSLA